jgi:SAM-dependent methyltransferase
MEVELWACDFSEAAIAEAKRNCPQGRFLVEQIPTHIYDGNSFDVIVISGLVNYYRDLAPLTEMVARLTKAGSLILITINVIDDFPDRHWDEETIRSTFGTLGKLSVQFYEKVGWFVEIGVVQ